MTNSPFLRNFRTVKCPFHHVLPTDYVNSLATYWTSGWIYGVVTASEYACAYYEYFSNWVDTILLIYFLYQLGLILFEYRFEF